MHNIKPAFIGLTYLFYLPGKIFAWLFIAKLFHISLFYRSAANRQHPPALYNLGLCYEMGLGVKVDEKVVSSMKI